MKIAFGMIVFNGDYVLKQCLDQVYPFASQILIAEGPVTYWQNKGFKTSTDETNKILDTYPDPENKIKIVHGKYSEKDEQCRAYMQFINDDIDYVWNLDSDEVYKTEDLKNIIKLLKDEQPTSVGIRSCSFYGGFENYLTGFELNKDNFLRIFKYVKGSTWQTHRPPTIKYPENANITLKHIDSETLFNKTGAQMYHYSYVFPDQVKTKISYYKDAVSLQNCIDDYFDKIYLPWVTADEVTREKIEKEYQGVHEFKPHIRGDCYTNKITTNHPEAIEKDLPSLQEKFTQQLIKHIQQRSAWYNEKTMPEQMLLGAEGKLWGFTLEEAPHFSVLNEAINTCGDSITMVDIGCGAGEVGRIFGNGHYVGCDLKHIIENVAKKKNPDLKYFDFDAYDNDFSFCKDFDLVLCNSFLSELVSSTNILLKILKHAKKYVVLHRETFGNSEKIETYTTYGDLKTIQTTICAPVFNKAVKNNFTPIYNNILQNNTRTIALRRIKHE